MKCFIDPQNFNRSIDIALSSSFDYGAAADRIQALLSHTPEENLYIRRDSKKIAFYKRDGDRQIYVSKKADEIYELARKKYLTLLLKNIESAVEARPFPRRSASTEKLPAEHRKPLRQLHDLVMMYAGGNLDLARIVMTPEQYRWYSSDFRQKKINTASAVKTNGGAVVRSKSEREIADCLSFFSVPFHYEQCRTVEVAALVNALKRQLRNAGFFSGGSTSYASGACYWNVPKELEWINTPGSIWKSYDNRRGILIMFNDFTTMAANGEEIVWEHEGMYDDFIYRCNASERISILQYTNTIPRKNIIVTYEDDTNDPEKLIDIIKRDILPRLWF